MRKRMWLLMAAVAAGFSGLTVLFRKRRPAPAPFDPCEYCATLLRFIRGVALLSHLQDGHGLSHKQAVRLTAALYERVAKRRAEVRN
jgi:hypothetical protein